MKDNRAFISPAFHMAAERGHHTFTIVIFNEPAPIRFSRDGHNLLV